MAISLSNLADKVTATLIVAQDGSGDYNGTTEEPIQQAIDQLHSENGGHIVVKKGAVTYKISNSIVLYSNIRLTGMNGTILELVNNSDVPVIKYDPSTFVFRSILEGFWIFGNSAGQTSTDAMGIYGLCGMSVQQSVIRNMAIQDCRGSALFVRSWLNSTISDITIEGSPEAGRGIVAEIFHGCTMINLRFSNTENIALDTLSCQNSTFTNIYVLGNSLDDSQVLKSKDNSFCVFTNITGLQADNGIDDQSDNTDCIYSNVILSQMFNWFYKLDSTSSRYGLMIP